MSIVRQNLLQDKNYTPYCGNSNCRSMPRTIRTSTFQFKCSCCGWESSFDEEFIEQYKITHGFINED